MTKHESEAKKIILILFVCVTQLCIAESWVVNSTSDSSDSSIGNGMCADMMGNCTLRAALEEANVSSGRDTIIIAISGATFPSLVYPVLQRDHLTIIGPGPNDFIIDGSNSKLWRGIYIKSDSNRLSNFTITGFKGDNIFLEGSDANSFLNVVSSDCCGTGVELIMSSNNTFRKCIFSQSHIGIRCLEKSNNNVIEESISMDNEHSGMTSFTSSGNTFRYNTLQSNQNGMYIIQANHTTIENNTISNSIDAGINIFESLSFGNIVQGNTITSALGPCVVLDQYAGNNTIQDNVMQGCGFGVIVGDMSGIATVSRNNISESGMGIQLLQNSDGARIVGNTIMQSCHQGIVKDPLIPISVQYVIKQNTVKISK